MTSLGAFVSFQVKAASAWQNKKESLDSDVKAREGLTAVIADSEKQLKKQQTALAKAEVRCSPKRTWLRAPGAFSAQSCLLRAALSDAIVAHYYLCTGAGHCGAD